MMKEIKTTILAFLLLVSLPAFSQDELPIVDPMLIRLQARLVSAADSTPVSYATVLNNRTHSGTTTNVNGYFTLEMLNIDSLIVSSVGYEKSVIKIPYNYAGQTTLLFRMLPVAYAVGQVDVQGEKPGFDLGISTGKPTDIAPQLRGDAFNDSPPILAAFFNPVSYWQYYLSKKEQRKREVRKAIALEKNWEMHSQNYNKEKVMMLTGLKELQADTFMIWFNSQEVLPYLSSEYQVRASIIEYFHYWQLEKATGK